MLLELTCRRLDTIKERCHSYAARMFCDPSAPGTRMTDPSSGRVITSRWRSPPHVLALWTSGRDAAVVQPALSALNFTPVEIGWCCATQAIAGLIAPALGRPGGRPLVAAESCLIGLRVLDGRASLGFVLVDRNRQLFCTSLAVWFAMGPTLSLGVAVTFTHLAVPERTTVACAFGTVGWVLTCWLLAYWFSEPEWAIGLRDWLRPQQSGSDLADIFRLGSFLACALGLYALTLPHTPPQRHPTTFLAPFAAMRLLRQRSFAVYCLVYLGWCMTIAFTSQLNPLLLAQYGIRNHTLPLVLTIGQATEIASLALLPGWLGRLGVRGTMLLGLGSWLISLLIVTAGEPLWLVLVSLACNGVCISAFLVAGQVFVNRRAHDEIRASAQALLAWFSGLGLLAGNLLVGWVRHTVHGAFSPTYAVGALLALSLLVAFGWGFREEEVDEIAEVPEPALEAIGEGLSPAVISSPRP